MDEAPSRKIVVDEERTLADLARLGYMTPDSPLQISIPRGRERDIIDDLLLRLDAAWDAGMEAAGGEVLAQLALTAATSFWSAVVADIVRAQEGNQELIHVALMNAAAAPLSHIRVLHYRVCTLQHSELFA